MKYFIAGFKIILVNILLIIGCQEAIADNALGVTIGAIRWDAWVGPTNTSGTGSDNVGLQVEKTLSPNKYHNRVPFFGTETGVNSILARELTQSIMDADIAYANAAGLNYWAFYYYPIGSGMDTARNLYLSSNVKNGLNFTFIINRSLPSANFGEVISAFSNPNYQKVLGNRPLLYIHTDPGNIYTKADIGNLRSQSTAAGLGNPYIVVMNGNPAIASSQLWTLGADAISSYTSAGSGGSPFAAVMQNDQLGWDSYAQTGYKVVPWVTTGWDPRPRIDNPVSWTKYSASSWAQPAMPSELSTSLQNALDWSAQHEQIAEPATVIMYAWNEFDEGGWLSPTITPGSSIINTDRITAIKNTLTYRSSSSWDATQTADKAFDGNYSTDWQAALGTAFAGQWLEVNFGRDSTFSQVTLSEYGNRTAGFQIQYLNGLEWKTAYTGTTIGTSRTISFPAVVGSRARIYFTAGVNTPIIYEFKINNVPVAQSPTTNLALNKSYQAFSSWDATQGPEKAFDGNLGTNWQGAGWANFANQWLEVDFGRKTSFSRATLSEYGNRTSAYRLEYWDGASWIPAYYGTTIGTSKTITFPMVTASRARIYFVSGSFTPIIYEFGLYFQ